MALKCLVCKKIPTVIGHRVEGKTKQVWCGNGAIYRTKDKIWCKPCWDKQVADCEAYRERALAESEKKLKATLASLKKGK